MAMSSRRRSSQSAGHHEVEVAGRPALAVVDLLAVVAVAERAVAHRCEPNACDL
jgi:hypothetical protein